MRKDAAKSIETLWNDALTFHENMTEENGDDGDGDENNLLANLLLENNESEMYMDVEQLSRDMNVMINQPNLCDVVFLVGDDRKPVYGVKAVLALRSRIFYETFYPHSSDENGIVNTVDGRTNTIGSRLHKAIFDATSFACLAPPRGALDQSESEVTTVHVTEFDYAVFKDLIQFLHEGSVRIRSRSCIGLMYAADQFGIEELRLACISHANASLDPKTALTLVLGAIHHLDDEFVASVVEKLLHYIDYHAEVCLSSPETVNQLPYDMLMRIMQRMTLSIQPLHKFHCIHKWITANDVKVEDKTVQKLIMTVDYAAIPSKTLMREVRPTALVADSTLVQAICVQETEAPKGSKIAHQNPFMDLHSNFEEQVQSLYEKLKNKSTNKQRKLLLGHSELYQSKTGRGFSARMHSLNLSARKFRNSIVQSPAAQSIQQHLRHKCDDDAAAVTIGRSNNKRPMSYYDPGSTPEPDVNRTSGFELLL